MKRWPPMLAMPCAHLHFEANTITNTPFNGAPATGGMKWTSIATVVHADIKDLY
jgi:hypothetical protein